MIRLTLRQFRTQAAVAIIVLVAVAIAFVETRGHLDHLYNLNAQANAACSAGSICNPVNFSLDEVDRLLELVGTVLVGIPALIGAFWGAPLIAREFESGTHRLAWTQSVTRTRWLAVKLTIVGLTGVAVTGVLSLLVTWWSASIDRSNSDRFGSGIFGERNVVPLGYAAFGFAVGVAAGILIRRTLPAMATTLVVFLATRMAFTYAVRPHLLAPVHKSLPLDSGSMGFGSTNGGPPTLMLDPPDIPNAWIYSSHIVDQSGHGLTAHIVANSCPNLELPGPPPSPGGRVSISIPTGLHSALEACVTKIGTNYHEVVTYLPPSRYWPLQWIETAIFFGVAIGLVVCCFWWIRRRAT